jgi:hypothetical protein
MADINHLIHKILIFLTLLSVCMFINLNNIRAQNEPGNDASIMLKEFYTQYVTESQKRPGPSRRKNINEIKKHYCTQNLLIKIATEELDSDPFLKAQDIDSSCLKTLTIKRDFKKNNLYQVTYLDSYSQHNRTIMIAVVKQKDEFKIDDIL